MAKRQTKSDSDKDTACVNCGYESSETRCPNCGYDPVEAKKLLKSSQQSAAGETDAKAE